MAKPRKPAKARHKTFDLLGLSRELRDMIYAEAFNGLPDSQWEFGNFNKPDYRTNNWQLTHNQPRLLRPISKFRRHGLLYCCKQVHTEYAELYMKTGLRATFHLSRDNIRTQLHSVHAFALEPYWTISPIVKANLRSAAFKVHWKPMIERLHGDHLDQIIDTFCNTLAEFTRLEHIAFSLCAEEMRRFPKDLLETMSRRVFASCTQLSHMKTMRFEADGRGYHEERELLKNAGGEWTTIPRRGGPKRKPGVQVQAAGTTQRLISIENFSFETIRSQ
ncbi:hypothetical protein EJ08DRAFT_697933 [Tothia fuscella]|uniref:Uncharacterized protein n=1 Tax=Tothia fuscella TaxID=1048955 RepID=A0A9P4TY37_9PEZI|nr:hypothetical protein EJ08DRAFT_697933 [Tothia fuscella]